jgi:hypothetical protein
MPNINIIRRVVLNNPPRGAVVAGSGYVGPGDIVGSWFAWYGLRAYSAAYAAPGNNPAIDIVDQAGANQLTVNILASGKLDLASINAWVTAHSVSTIKVGKVYDQAGTTHVSQATLANMPTLALNVIGALPSLHFDASQAQGLFSASGALSTAQPFYMSSVHIRQRGNLTDFNSVLITDQTVGILTGTGPDQIGIFGGSVNSIAAADLAVHSLKALFNGSTSALYVDDLLTPISGGAAAFSGSTIGLGAQPGGQPRRWDGYIFEAGLIAGDQSASNHALYANEASYGYFSDQSLNANGFDIILLAGQSNMAGRAAQGTLDPTPPGVLKQLSCYPRADSTWYRSTCIAGMTEIVGALVRHKRFYELTDQSPEFFHCSFGAFAQGSFEF